MTSTEKILKVAHSIPVLSRKLNDLEYHPLEFDPEKFYFMFKHWSRGERICGIFILHIWSPGFLEEKGESFQLHKAVQVLAQAQRDAIATWVKNPIFP